MKRSKKKAPPWTRKAVLIALDTCWSDDDVRHWIDFQSRSGAGCRPVTVHVLASHETNAPPKETP